MTTLGEDWQAVAGNLHNSRIGKGGGKSKVVGDVLQGSGTGGTNFWGGYVSDSPQYGPGPGEGSKNRVY